MDFKGESGFFRRALRRGFLEGDFGKVLPCPLGEYNPLGVCPICSKCMLSLCRGHLKSCMTLHKCLKHYFSGDLRAGNRLGVLFSILSEQCMQLLPSSLSQGFGEGSQQDHFEGKQKVGSNTFPDMWSLSLPLSLLLSLLSVIIVCSAANLLATRVAGLTIVLVMASQLH